MVHPLKDHFICTPSNFSTQVPVAGAKVVVSVAPGEIATIRRVGKNRLGLNDLLGQAADEGAEVLVLEEFREHLDGRRDTPQIATAKDAVS